MTRHFRSRAAAGLALAFAAQMAFAADHDGSVGDPRVHTFSIVGFDPATGDLGIAVASKFLGVGSVVPYAKAGVGAVATQSAANTAYGPDGLKMLEEGKSAKETVDALIAADGRPGGRQVGIVDAKGNAAAFTGPDSGTWAGHVVGDHYTAQGNLLAGEEVVKKMGAAFEEARKVEGTGLADWLLAALAAGDEAGGDKRGKQSAALMVARAGAGYGGNDRFIDLRVEDGKEPIPELKRLLELHKEFFRGNHRRRGARRGGDARGGDARRGENLSTSESGGENRGRGENRGGGQR
jgi:uncharacterized Ntn-hydrolase superfamily protein